MTYFLYVRASKRSGGGRHWFTNSALAVHTDVLAAYAFNAMEAESVERAIPLATVYRLPCDSTIHLTPAMRRTLNIN